VSQIAPLQDDARTLVRWCCGGCAQDRATVVPDNYVILLVHHRSQPTSIVVLTESVKVCQRQASGRSGRGREDTELSICRRRPSSSEHTQRRRIMAAVHVLDDYYLAITFLTTVAYQLLFFAIAFSFKFDKLTDFAGGTNFILLAILTLSFSENQDEARNIVVSIFIILWAARLSGFLLFRILKTGKDDRFDDKRDKFWSFLGFWVL
jgi:hypothetical protein